MNRRAFLSVVATAPLALLLPTPQARPRIMFDRAGVSEWSCSLLPGQMVRFVPADDSGYFVNGQECVGTIVLQGPAVFPTRSFLLSSIPSPTAP